LFGVAVKSAGPLCAISVPFNNGLRENAITISIIGSGGEKFGFRCQTADQTQRANRQGCPAANCQTGCLPTWSANYFECRLRFAAFQSIEDSMGQQHRVQAKRKRRLAYLRRKKAAAQAAATRSTPSKQPAPKEAAASE